MIKAFSLPGFEKLSENDLGKDETKEDEMEEDEMDDDELVDDGMVGDCDVHSSSEHFYEEIDQTCHHVRCFAHTLQLVIKDGFKHVGSISKVLGKASAIVSHVKKSIHAWNLKNLYKKLQLRDGILS